MSREWLKYTRDCFMIKKNEMGGTECELNKSKRNGNR